MRLRRAAVAVVAVGVAFAVPVAYGAITSDEPDYVVEGQETIDERAQELPPGVAESFREDAEANLETYQDLVEAPEAASFCRDVVLQNDADNDFCLGLLEDGQDAR